MNEHYDQPETGSDWQKAPFVNLIRYKPSQVYFARFRVKGKLIRRSLKTDQLTVAKLRLSYLEKSERQQAQSIHAVANCRMTFGYALAVFQSRLQDKPDFKPRTGEYYEYRIAALLKSWPGSAAKDVDRISNAECLDWSARNAWQHSSFSHNHTVSILRKVFAVAIESGVLYENPALSAQRVRERTRKRIEHPGFDQLDQLVAEVRRSGSGI